MAAPNLHELEILGEFRANVKDLNLNELLNSDMELLRWIRARDYNLDQAELMLRKHMKWREEIGYDQLAFWDMPKLCEDLMPETMLGFDDDNCPVLVSPSGKWDMKKTLEVVGSETALLSRWKIAKTIEEAMKGKLTSEGVPVTQYSVITDLQGLTISQGTIAVLQAVSDCAQIFEANFPESSKYLIVINAPWFFATFYKCLKPFLSEKTKAKTHIYGKCRKEWTEFLGSKFPPHVIPRLYGGSNNIEIPLL
ncbi:unnamed protein product [Allacma fusca]|uniref:CRAL-TRIO domain-containing protein n=1 Tax=Allacma fusca TaxID=39272 RepID=A0A8J2JH87_9HEXA|nr:unnamed protein product [Allacma fusca]